MKIRIAAMFALVMTLHGHAVRAQPAAPPPPDAKLHADTVKLIELSGIKKRLEAGRDKSIADSKKAMQTHCPMCTPQFFDEWAKRMTDRYRVDDYVAVYVQTYEKYFTDAEILELTAMQGNSGATPSPALKAKVSSVMGPVMSEVYSKRDAIGAKRSADITDEIAKEHPGWIVRPPEPPPTQ